MNHHRLTIIARPAGYRTNWTAAARQVVFLEEDPSLRVALLTAMCDPAIDVERVILDDVLTAESFLALLASLPAQFQGDVLRLDDSGHAYLSATGRGGDRVLYALSEQDVRFYCITHGLSGGEILERTA